MITLVDLQKLFSQGINSENTAILDYLCSSKKLNQREQFAIYQSSIIGNLQNTLKEIFSVCQQLVGLNFFYIMATDYISKNTSKSADLAKYGETFPEFIENYPPAHSLLYLSDVAKLEWALHRTTFAAPTPFFDFQKMTQPATQIYFSLPDSSFTLQSVYPIHDIWEMHQVRGENKPSLTLLDNQQYYFFIWQKELRGHIDIVSEIEWNILEWIKINFSLNAIVKKINSEFDDYNPADILPAMIKKGWIRNS